ncbi:MAG: transcriptional regulator KorA [Burkholderiaceae bacterium]
MKKRLTEAQFQACIRGLDVGQQTIEIAHGVLVLGQPQASFVASLGLSRGAVSQAVNRVWAAFVVTDLPQGYERVSAVLPEHQAYIVKKWAEDAKKREAKK